MGEQYGNAHVGVPRSSRALLLAGCTVMDPRVERSREETHGDGSKECTVTVMVKWPRHSDIKRHMSVVIYDLILVRGRNKQVDIHWKLEGDNGAVVSRVMPSSSKIRCSIARWKPRTGIRARTSIPLWRFQYVINVHGQGQLVWSARRLQSLDPWGSMTTVAAVPAAIIVMPTMRP